MDLGATRQVLILSIPSKEEEEEEEEEDEEGSADNIIELLPPDFTCKFFSISSNSRLKLLQVTANEDCTNPSRVNVEESRRERRVINSCLARDLSSGVFKRGGSCGECEDDAIQSTEGKNEEEKRKIDEEKKRKCHLTLPKIKNFQTFYLVVLGRKESQRSLPE